MAVSASTAAKAVERWGLNGNPLHHPCGCVWWCAIGKQSRRVKTCESHHLRELFE
jgi:hypothetical protein